MPQRSITCYITPEELVEVFELSVAGFVPFRIIQIWNDLSVSTNSLSEDLEDPLKWRFHLGFRQPDPEWLTSSRNLWNNGFIQFDNPKRSNEFLGQVQIVIQTELPDSEAYQISQTVFRRIVSQVKKRSTLGKHLFCTMDNQMEKHTWLSEGARLWMTNGGRVTPSFHLDRAQAPPQEIHRLV